MAFPLGLPLLAFFVPTLREQAGSALSSPVSGLLTTGAYENQREPGLKCATA